MKVSEFLKVSDLSLLYQLVDANKTGFRTNPSIITEADGNVIRERYSDKELINFDIATKRKLILYVK